MRFLFTLSLLFVLNVAFAQETEQHVLQINLTDSLTGDPSDIEIAYVITENSRDVSTFQQSQVGVFVMQLDEGQYKVNFKHTDGSYHSIEVDLKEDVVKNIMLSPAKAKKE